MGWQASDWIALAGVLVSPLGAVAVVFLTVRQRRDERLSDERAKARADAAAVLGPVLVLLNDAEPYRLAVQTGPHTPAAFADLWRRWMELRPSLGIMAATDPALGNAALLVVAIDNALYSARLWTENVSSDRFKDAAQRDHAEAMRQAVALINLVWRQAGGKGELVYPPAPREDQQDQARG